jgi:predicted transcriptional regulator
MKRKGISQMPVLKEGKVCGIINEKIILEKIAEGKMVGDMTSEEIMEDCPPIVSPETSKKTVLSILKEYSIVLIAEKGEVKGLISKSDVLGMI